MDIDVAHVWVTRWSKEEQMVQVRTYVDSISTTNMLQQNEVWWNATTTTIRSEFEPGPAGMPNLTYLEKFVSKKDRPQH